MKHKTYRARTKALITECMKKGSAGKQVRITRVSTKRCYLPS